MIALLEPQDPIFFEVPKDSSYTSLARVNNTRAIYVKLVVALSRRVPLDVNIVVTPIKKAPLDVNKDAMISWGIVFVQMDVFSSLKIRLSKDRIIRFVIERAIVPVCSDNPEEKGKKFL